MSSNARSAARVNLAAELPGAVLAQLTDINTAIAWSDWIAYLTVCAGHH